MASNGAEDTSTEDAMPTQISQNGQTHDNHDPTAEPSVELQSPATSVEVEQKAIAKSEVDIKPEVSAALVAQLETKIQARAPLLDLPDMTGDGQSQPKRLKLENVGHGRHFVTKRDGNYRRTLQFWHRATDAVR